MTTTPVQIEQIRFTTAQRSDGFEYQQARVWIAGLPLQIDLDPHVERVLRRIATEAGQSVIDARVSAQRNAGMRRTAMPSRKPDAQ